MFDIIAPVGMLVLLLFLLTITIAKRMIKIKARYYFGKNSQMTVEIFVTFVYTISEGIYARMESALPL